MEMGVVSNSIILLLCFTIAIIPSSSSSSTSTSNDKKDLRINNSQQRVSIDIEGGPESVLWVVQLSDLHFSVHHPDRALDFKSYVGPTLSMVNPSLVLITGDLTDAKSKDYAEARQDELEWVEYQSVMEDVINRSGLDKRIFYDMRGNHDNFGIPMAGASFDFFPIHSINGQLGRTGNVNSVTLQMGEQRHLFVGFDSTASVGVRGPTNVFGHPTDQLLSKLDSKLSQWDFQSTKPVTKISFGHFPLSFSVNSQSGKSLKDIFLKHSVTYLCGHLHESYGKNLKRHHLLGPCLTFSEGLFQLNAHQLHSQSTNLCSNTSLPIKEFWEWEMGDWRKGRVIRILAIDRGLVSFVDMKLKSGAKNIIILPTFPLDSRFMLTTSYLDKYKCDDSINPSSYETIRALVFSVSPIKSVVARIYDSRPKNRNLILEAPMRKLLDNSSRGDLYIAPWNFKSFEDPSPDRYWLQIEAIDLIGRSSLTEPRPFSVNGISAKLSWTWTEFRVMGCQFDALYYPLFWSVFMLMLCILLLSKGLDTFTKQYTFLNFRINKGIINLLAWSLMQFSKDSLLWFGMLGYLLNLILFPWFKGKPLTAGGETGYMTYRGWVMQNVGGGKKLEFIGFPDIMMIVLPHLFSVVLPTVLYIGALAVEADIFRSYLLSTSLKKRDDNKKNDKGNSRSFLLCRGGRWIRYLLLLACLATSWKHLMNCRYLMKAYEMSPLLHFPVYSFSIPLLLAYTVYSTRMMK